MIKAEIVADSKNEHGDRITTMLVTFPRIILAEFNTHRMLSKNTASSRAIPFAKMVKSIEENPFIPIAWQKEHKGMQGSEYFTELDKALVVDGHYPDALREIKRIWLADRDERVAKAKRLHSLGVTKQLCNRLLEPFMWVTVLVTATEWENFFALRCPQYQVGYKVGTNEEKDVIYYRSKKDLINAFKDYGDAVDGKKFTDFTELNWLQVNKGQAEIHMMALAEAMWDAYNESEPKQLKAGEWHIPFLDKINHFELGEAAASLGICKEAYEYLNDRTEENRLKSIEAHQLLCVKVSTTMNARTSYTVVGEDQKPLSYERMIQIHDELLAANPKHMSPFEHCARAMTQLEWVGDSKFNIYGGFCGNFRGFIQYRKMIPNENITK